MKQDFVIPLNGLAQGRTVFHARADKEFFEEFENREIMEAGVDAEISVEKSGNLIDVDCLMDGTVTVACDRCLESLVLPVHASAVFSVRFGSEMPESVSSDEGRETIMIPENSSDLDMSQAVYDYVCLSLPVRRVHAEGECNPDTVRYLCGEEDSSAGPSENPFAGLRSLLKN